MSRQMLRAYRPLELVQAATSSSSQSASSRLALRPLASGTLAAAASAPLSTRTLSTALFSPRSPLPSAVKRSASQRQAFGSFWPSLAPRRGYSSHQRQHQDDRSGPRPEEDSSAFDEPAPDKLPLTQRIKALTKKYGWWAVGVYSVLSLFDFGIAYGLVSYLGMARVQRLERSVKAWVKETTGWSWAEEKAVQDLKDVAKESEKEIRKQGYDSAFWAQVAIVSLFPPLPGPPPPHWTSWRLRADSHLLL